MGEFISLVADNADAGLAVIVLLGVLSLVVLGYLVTAKHLEDWKTFAEKQEARADALQKTLDQIADRDSAGADLIRELNATIINTFLRDRS